MSTVQNFLDELHYCSNSLQQSMAVIISFGLPTNTTKRYKVNKENPCQLTKKRTTITSTTYCIPVAVAHWSETDGPLAHFHFFREKSRTNYLIFFGCFLVLAKEMVCSI